ncbi:MAG: DUF4173 domain-containing protein [Lachnospiraceae bacterium]|nr:DUF4173 domain-containing protein [Lachnospiraceae bacterium]
MENQSSEIYVEEQSSETTPESRTLRENFQIFGVATFLFACFYSFCMYKNDAGITYLLMVAAGLYYVKYCGKQFGFAAKKGTLFYTVCILLLGISTFCTDDARIIFFNKTGVFLLMISMVLFNVFETKSWGLGKYVVIIVQSVLWSWGEWVRPFGDAKYYCKNKLGSKGKTILYAAVSVAVSVPVVAVVLNLLMSADVLFGDMAQRVLESLNLKNIIGVLALTTLVFFAVYGFLSYVVKGEIREDVSEGKKAESILAIPMAGILTALYLMFSVVQIGGLFLGKMTLPKGYTYAMYAREGFFQLLAVSIFNLLLVLVGIQFFKKNKILTVLLTLMSLCTFIMIASSAMRMILYIKTYHLTFLRILVLWGLMVIAALFVGVITTLYKNQFSLFRYSVVVVTVCYLGLSFAHPDYWIAKYNVSHQNKVIAMDSGYLRDLSADAAPVLVPYFGMKEADSRWNTDDVVSVRKFNVSRFVAKQLVEKQ